MLHEFDVVYDSFLWSINLDSFVVSLLLLKNDVFAKEILGIDRSPCRRGRREFFGESTMARKLANLWPCRRAKSLCGSTEIARAWFFSMLNGPRTTIGCCDELFGRTHDRHELFLSFSFLFFLYFSLILYQSHVLATQFQMRIANRLLLFANRILGDFVLFRQRMSSSLKLIRIIHKHICHETELHVTRIKSNTYIFRLHLQ